VFAKDTIDPERSRDNEVYGSDAWTPTFPAVEYEADEEVEKRIREKYYEIIPKIDRQTAPIVVGVMIAKDRSGTASIAKIRTVHARGDYRRQITDDSVLYLNPNKKETSAWFQALGIRVPLGGKRFGFIRSIAGDTQNVKYSDTADDKRNLFSMSDMVEETRDLIAVHNLTEQNLKNTIELGGFAMPSIAVIKAEQGHSKYGPNTRVFLRFLCGREETLEAFQSMVASCTSVEELHQNCYTPRKDRDFITFALHPWEDGFLTANQLFNKQPGRMVLLQYSRDCTLIRMWEQICEEIQNFWYCQLYQQNNQVLAVVCGTDNNIKIKKMQVIRVTPPQENAE